MGRGSLSFFVFWELRVVALEFGNVILILRGTKIKKLRGGGERSAERFAQRKRVRVYTLTAENERWEYLHQFERCRYVNVLTP